MVTCSACEKEASVFGCGGCSQRFYCSKDCIIADWKAGHENECKPTTGVQSIGAFFIAAEKDKNKGKKTAIVRRNSVPAVPSQAPTTTRAPDFCGIYRVPLTARLALPGVPTPMVAHGLRTRFIITFRKSERRLSESVCGESKHVFTIIAQNFAFDAKSADLRRKSYLAYLRGNAPNDTTLDGKNIVVLGDAAIYAGIQKIDSIRSIIPNMLGVKGSGEALCDVFKFRVPSISGMTFGDSQTDIGVVARDPNTNQEYAFTLEAITSDKDGRLSDRSITFQGVIPGKFENGPDNKYLINSNDTRAVCGFQIEVNKTEASEGGSASRVAKLSQVALYLPVTPPAPVKKSRRFLRTDISSSGEEPTMSVDGVEEF